MFTYLGMGLMVGNMIAVMATCVFFYGKKGFLIGGAVDLGLFLVAGLLIPKLPEVFHVPLQLTLLCLIPVFAALIGALLSRRCKKEKAARTEEENIYVDFLVRGVRQARVPPTPEEIAEKEKERKQAKEDRQAAKEEARAEKAKWEASDWDYPD